MLVVITGVKRQEYEKNGKSQLAVNYSGTKAYTAYDQESADCEGVDTIREYSRVDFDVHPGDTVEFVYEPGFQDRATLVDIRLVTPAEKPPFEDKKEKPADKAAGK